MLSDLRRWRLSCAPTALCAATGLSPDRVCIAIFRAAAEDGEHPDHLDSANPRHWLRALDKLGFAVREDILAVPLPIPEFMSANDRSGVMLAAAQDRAGRTAHVFAIDGKSFVDTYTDGAVCTWDGRYPPSIAELYVHSVYAVAPKSAALEVLPAPPTAGTAPRSF